ncbi:hypothetical protein BH20GEM1_BH20GEM1_09660 [soil metagenome]
MSNVQQHSWLGYHVLFPPGQETGDPDAGSGMVPFTAKQALECGSLDTGEPSSGEDVDLTNYSQEKRGRLFVVRKASPWSLSESWGGRLRHVLSSLIRR